MRTSQEKLRWPFCGGVDGKRVVDAEVDDGHGGTIRITRQAETTVDSIPRPADPCELRYPGQWQDELDLEADCVGDDCTMPGPLEDSFSLFENGFRWYKPGWGRYGQADPIGLKGGPNLFSYAKQNPLRWIDPNGLCCEPTDECPTGKWQYRGNTFSGGEAWGGIWAFGASAGISGFGGEFQCLNGAGFPFGARMKVHIACVVNDAIGLDIGVDFFETSMGETTDVCSSKDLLGSFDAQFLALPIFGFSSLNGGPWNIEASVSVGAGYAEMTCEVIEVKDED